MRRFNAKDFLIVGAGLYIFIFLSFYFGYLSDDAFITFRYVKNFLNGLGPVYNPGELVEGFTSPLWFMILAGLGRLGIDIVFAGRAVGVIGGILQIILIYLLFKKIKLSSVSRLLGVLFISLSNVIAVWALSGLEPVMFSFLILANFYLISLTEKWNKKSLLVLSGVSILLVLTRLEGLFVPVIISGFFVYQWLIKKAKLEKFAVFYLLPFISVIALSFLIRFRIFGDWLPNTFYAKVGSTIDLYFRGFSYVFDFFWNYSFIILFVLLIIAGLIIRTKISILSVLFIFAIIAETIIVGGDGLPMYRFLLPALPYFAVLLALFLESINKNIPDKNIKYTLIVGICAVLFYRAVMPPITGNQYILYKDQKDYEMPRWVAVGKWLKKNTKAGESAAMVPIGAVGYYSDRYVYDMLGLTDKYIARKKTELGKGWAGHEKRDGKYILSKRPTYLLLGNIQTLDYKLDLKDPQFVKPEIPAIRAREDDIFTSELWESYEKKVADIGEGYYLHYLQLKK